MLLLFLLLFAIMDIMLATEVFLSMLLYVLIGYQLEKEQEHAFDEASLDISIGMNDFDYLNHKSTFLFHCNRMSYTISANFFPGTVGFFNPAIGGSLGFLFGSVYVFFKIFFRTLQLPAFLLIKQTSL